MNNIKNHLYVDVHVLQTVPPSCVNRDDTGSPKTAIYGGVRRARVSSQAWKRAVRVAFREMYEPKDLGVRTKRLVTMVENHIHALDPEADAEKLALEVLGAAGITVKGKEAKNEADVLFFMSDAQAEALARIAVYEPQKMTEKEPCKSALKANPSIDMALFGRMVAADASLNYDAAAQVAHAISTHQVQNEFDYFTAVDDLSPEDSAGAGHLGTVEFNSSTLYRYATVNISELALNMREETPSAVRNFLEAFICSMPTGKQNTFANRTLPDAVYVTLREDQPVNLAGAFERPVLQDPEGGYGKASCARLTEYAEKVYDQYVNAPKKAWAMGMNVQNAETLPLPRLLEEVKNCLSTELHEG